MAAYPKYCLQHPFGSYRLTTTTKITKCCLKSAFQLRLNTKILLGISLSMSASAQRPYLLGIHCTHKCTHIHMYLYIHANVVGHVLADARCHVLVYTSTRIGNFVFNAHIKFTGLKFGVAQSNFSDFKECRNGEFLLFFLTVEIF